MQKARRLMDENSVSFQMFLILLSSITLGSESQYSRVQGRSEQYLDFCFVLFICTGGACAEAKIWRCEMRLREYKSTLIDKGLNYFI